MNWFSFYRVNCDEVYAIRISKALVYLGRIENGEAVSSIYYHNEVPFIADGI